MKGKSKKIINIAIVIVIIALVFLCTFNFAYAYFTATAHTSGDYKFGYLDVRLAYYSSGTGTITSLASGEDSLIVYPNTTESISRGSTFKFATSSGGEINYLGFYTNSSCASYVAIKVNAYKFTNDELDTSVNYGTYFILNPYSNNIALGSGTDSERADVYYFKSALSSGSAFIDFADSMTLSEDAPIDLLNSQIQISITFKAVQQPNEAFKSAFGSDWGYYSSWS